jgi:hypothetical protein
VDGLNDQQRAIAILDIGEMHLGTDQQIASIGSQCDGYAL